MLYWAERRGAPEPLMLKLEAGSEPDLLEASILWRGIKIVVQLLGSTRGSSSTSYPPGTVTEAWVDCDWAEAQFVVDAACDFAVGKPLEAFLDAMDEEWETLRSERSSRRESGSLPLEKETCAESPAQGFAEWLINRPPLIRMGVGTKGLSWDHPVSKAEKRDLLVLQLFVQQEMAEERQNRRRGGM